MTIPLTARRPYDVRKIVQAIKYPRPDLFLISAHRGARWNGIPENVRCGRNLFKVGPVKPTDRYPQSKESIIHAADLGVACIEVDLRLTQDGHVVLLHDEFLGRVTDVAEQVGRTDVYSPYTGKGFNPSVGSVRWCGMMQTLKLKEEHGKITYIFSRVLPKLPKETGLTTGRDETVLDLETMLNLIESEGIEMIVFMDIKGKNCNQAAYDIIKRHTNARGIPALEWCVWKYESSNYPYPEDLENSAWFQDAVGGGIYPLIIPVYEPPHNEILDPLASIQAYTTRPYVLSVEIEAHDPSGLYRDLIEHIQSPDCPIKACGWFAPFGDLYPWDGKKISFDLGRFEIPWTTNDVSKMLAFVENEEPVPFSELPGCDDPELRHDIGLFRSAGYTWVIADEPEVLLEAFRNMGLREGESALYLTEE